MTSSDKMHPIGEPLNASPYQDRSRANVIFALAGVLLTLLTSSMFQAIATVAMPRAIAELNGFARYSWPSTSFSLTSAIAMLVFTKLSDLYGRKLLCLYSTAMFVCSLLVGATAGIWPIPIDGMNQLVVGQAVLGLSSGAIVGLTYTLIGDLFPPSERARYLGLLMVVWALAFVTGPGVGGWITDNLSWRWAYIASAPLGIIAITTTYFRLPGIGPLLGRRMIDWAGIGVLCGWIEPLLLALTVVGQVGWSASIVKALLIASAVSLAVFLLVEQRAAEPLIVLSLFRDRRISLVSLNLLLTGGSIYGVSVYLPLFIQGVLGLSATKSATIFTPYMVSAMVGNLAGGYLLSKTGKCRLFALAGSGVAAIGLFLLSQMNRSTAQGEIIRNAIVCGIAFGVLTVTYDVTVQNAAPREHMGVATGSAQFFYALGGGIGLTAFGTILLSLYHAHFDALIPSGAPSALVLAFNNPLRLIFEKSNLEAVSSQVANGRVVLARLIEGSQAGLLSGVRFIFLLSSGFTAASFIVNLFLGETPPQKEV